MPSLSEKRLNHHEQMSKGKSVIPQGFPKMFIFYFHRFKRSQKKKINLKIKYWSIYK